MTTEAFAKPKTFAKKTKSKSFAKKKTTAKKKKSTKFAKPKPFEVPKHGSGKPPTAEALAVWFGRTPGPFRIADICRRFHIGKNNVDGLRASLRELADAGRIKISGHGPGTNYASAGNE